MDDNSTVTKSTLNKSEEHNIVSIIVAIALLLIAINTIAIAKNGEVRAKVSERFYVEAISNYDQQDYLTALKTFRKIYRMAPEDTRFKQGLLDTQQQLIDQSLDKHRASLFLEAIEGYSAVIKAPEISASERSFIKINIARAKEQQEAFGLEDYLEEGNLLLKKSDPFSALELFKEGYIVLEKEELLLEIKKSLAEISSWGKRAQRDTNFEAAIKAYDIILNSAYEDEEIKADTLRLKNYAELNYGPEDLLSKANDIFQTEPLLSLELYEDGSELYPEYKEGAFSKGLKENATLIFEKSKENHKNKLYEEAAKGYQALVKIDTLEGKLLKEAAAYLELAEKRQPFYLKIAYLTFDDGPSVNTLRILDILKNYNAKATFFVTGNSTDFGRMVYQKILDEGHAIGNHSYTHRYKSIYSSVEAFKEDFFRLENLLYETVGIKPIIMRYPGGSNNTVSHKYGSKTLMSEIIKEMNSIGYIYYDWNVDSLDASKIVQDKNVIISAVLGQSKNRDRAIILMHDSIVKTTTVEALPTIMEGLKAQGFTFETLP